MRMQRLGSVRVSGELMRAMFFTAAPDRWFQVREGLPPDAEYVRHYEDFERNETVYVFTHPSFPLVAPGELIYHVVRPNLHARFDPLPAPGVSTAPGADATPARATKLELKRVIGVREMDFLTPDSGDCDRPHTVGG